MSDQPTPLKPLAVYIAISAITGKLAAFGGIAKDRKTQGGSVYNFRGIDDVYNVLSPLLAEHGLVMLPRVLKREVTERVTKSGGAMFYVVVEVEFDFVSATDGSTHTVKTFGEAMDTSDKATNKAMSAAFKYAAFMSFAIPTEGDHDTENASPEVKAQTTPPPRGNQAPSNLASDKQKGAIGAFFKQLDVKDKADILSFAEFVLADQIANQGMTAAQASKLIEKITVKDQGKIVLGSNGVEARDAWLLALDAGRDGNG